MRRFNILLIENDEGRLYKIEEVLKPLDTHVHRVSTGEDALFTIYRENIDIVILDGDIKDMNSLEVVDTILSYDRLRDTLLILITESERDDEYILKAYSLGITDYIRKPINYEILKYKINRLIEVVKEKIRFERKSVILNNRINDLEITLRDTRQQRDELQVSANIDTLTQIPNRGMFEQVLKDEWYRLLRNRDPLSLLMIDIDNFKKYNDMYGHLKGDKCLYQVATIIDDSFNRAADFVARYGGEEFVVIIPHFSLEEAKQMGDVLRENINKRRILHEGSPNGEYLTVSVGAATIIPNAKFRIKDLVNEADNALYLAKKSGRDIVKGIKLN